MQHPLLIVALLYAFGLVLADHISIPWLIPWALALVCAIGGIVWARGRKWLLPPLLVLCGMANLSLHTTVIAPHDIRALACETPAEVRVRGTLLTTPVQRLPGMFMSTTPRSLAELRLASVQFVPGAWKPACGRILVTTPGNLPEGFYAGQTVEISGVLAPPQSRLAEGLFNYAAYLRRQEIYLMLRPSGPEEWHWISGDRSAPYADQFIAWAKRVTARGLPEEDLALQLLWAMALGSKDVLANDAYEPFVQSGTMHIFAISGLHIALIAGILVSLLRAARIPRMWCGAVIIPMLWFYAGATGWQPSAVRSTVMMSVIVAGWSLERPANLLNSLGAAALIILLWDPHQLFQASFQLSFCVVLSIALVLPPIKRWTDQWFQTDPLLPATLVPRWRRWLESPIRGTLNFFATSTAAWLGSWPLTAFYFHMFSPVTLLANVAMVPLSSAALACTLGGIVCGACLPAAGELFNHAAWFWMTLMIEISDFAIQIPGAYWNVRAPGMVDLVIYYGALVAVLTGFVFRPRQRHWMLLSVTCVCAYYGVVWYHRAQTVELTVLPLSGGSGIHFDAPGTSHDLLIDCGNTNSAHFVTMPYLRAKGVNQLNALVLTHGDSKRMVGAPVLEGAFDIGHVITSSVRFRSAAYRRVVAALDHPQNRRLERNRGDAIGRWRVLHPSSSDRFPQADDGALVLLGEFHGARVLLLSELGRPGQRALLERTADLRADIVVAGLPEKGEPLFDALIEAIRPRLIVITDSEYPATKRASRALRNRLERSAPRVLFTRNAGAVTLTFDRQGWRARTMGGAEWVFPQKNLYH